MNRIAYAEIALQQAEKLLQASILDENPTEEGPAAPTAEQLRATIAYWSTELETRP